MNPTLQVSQTEFDLPRGVHGVEVTQGFAQIRIDFENSPLVQERLKVLQCLAEHGIRIHQLKLHPSGLAFLMDEKEADRACELLPCRKHLIQLQKDHAVVTVWATNVRNENGLIARIVSAALRTGAKMEHLADRHDCFMIAATIEDAQQIQETLKAEFSLR